MAVILSVFVAPIAIYVIAPPIARAALGEVPGFRELPGRDNYVYVLSPWKHNETGARTLGESILSTLPPNSVFFADYSIWSIINYLQIVENARPDIDLIMLPGAGSAIAAHTRSIRD